MQENAGFPVFFRQFYRPEKISGLLNYSIIFTREKQKTLSKFLLNKNLKSPSSMLIFHVDLFLQNA